MVKLPTQLEIPPLVKQITVLIPNRKCDLCIQRRDTLLMYRLLYITCLRLNSDSVLQSLKSVLNIVNTVLSDSPQRLEEMNRNFTLRQ